MTPKEKLEAHSSEFRREIIQVAPGIHAAIGYGASNATMIEGETGLIIVDTLESIGAAEALLADFRQISDKPIHTIVYTHSHRDHVGGASVFVEGAGSETPPEIIARQAATNMLGAKEVAHISKLRAKRQFAIGMPSWVRINLGIGPGERPLKGLGAGYLPPTRLLAHEKESLVIDGITMDFVSAPGETSDTMLIWFPEQETMIGADNYYKSFPNLYPIRGDSYRDVALWIDSLETMLAFDTEHLIPGHSRPLHGRAHIQAVLSDYRDGIRHVLESTLEGMNRGMTPDELVASVKLPDHLAESPYLQEFYGSIAWSVRAIFTGYLGWFDGNPTHIFPLSQREEAIKIIDISGGPVMMKERIEVALQEGEYQWALQMADYLLVIDYHTDQIRAFKAKALTALADEQINATARHYYLTYAHELRQA